MNCTKALLLLFLCLSVAFTQGKHLQSDLVHNIPNDRDVFSILEDFYKSTNGPGWRNNTNWLHKEVPYCNWYGITCEDFLIKLDLQSNQLSGSIPTSLGKLTELQQLDLSSNQLSGSIPSSLGQLTQLGYLLLSNNQLSGPIPSFLGNLTVYLDLSYNQLSGTIPSSLGKLPRLGYVHLSNNQLSGPIPSLGNFTVLLDLSYNQLSAFVKDFEIPTHFVLCYMNENPFVCPIPPWAITVCQATCG